MVKPIFDRILEKSDNPWAPVVASAVCALTLIVTQSLTHEFMSLRIAAMVEGADRDASRGEESGQNDELLQIRESAVQKLQSQPLYLAVFWILLLSLSLNLGCLVAFVQAYHAKARALEAPLESLSQNLGRIVELLDSRDSEDDAVVDSDHTVQRIKGLLHNITMSKQSLHVSFMHDKATPERRKAAFQANLDDYRNSCESSIAKLKEEWKALDRSTHESLWLILKQIVENTLEPCEAIGEKVRRVMATKSTELGQSQAS